MSTPRTYLQRCADHRKTFPRKVNDRRVELIEKEHAGFTEEEGGRSFVGDPAWKAECERRYRANLTDAERAELAECDRILDGWLAGSPWAEERRAFLADMEAEIGRLKAKLKVRAEGRS